MGRLQQKAIDRLDGPSGDSQENSFQGDTHCEDFRRPNILCKFQNAGPTLGTLALSMCGTIPACTVPVGGSPVSLASRVHISHR
jgi:hypothetical protein